MKELSGGSTFRCRVAALSTVRTSFFISFFNGELFIFTSMESYLSVIIEHTTTETSPSHLQRGSACLLLIMESSQADI